MNKTAAHPFKECKTDNPYVRYYRWLQGRWLLANNIPVKKKPGQADSEVYGNYTSDPDANFMTPSIRKLVNAELSPARKGDRLIDEKRMRENLLSSQPLCFNLFGELSLRLDKALRFFNILYNGYFKSIDNILFEHNPARRDPGLTGDRSAFDVFVEYTGRMGQRGFIGVEVKYSETLREGGETVNDILDKQFCDQNRTRRDRYRELSEGIFTDARFEELEKLPLFQIWRDHLLAVSMLKAFPEKYDEGIFLFLSPHGNVPCREGVGKYVGLLGLPEGLVSRFYHDWLEDYIDTLDAVFDEEWTRQMAVRYLGRVPIPSKRRGSRDFSA